METLGTKETEDWDMTIIYTPPNVNKDLLLVEGEFNDGKSEETGILIPLELLLSDEDCLFEQSRSVASSCHFCDTNQTRINYLDVCGKIDRPIEYFITETKYICDDCSDRLSEKIQKQAMDAFKAELTAHQL